MGAASKGMMTEERTFELSLERIALIRRMVIAWNEAGAGAPIVHPEAPYGSGDRDGDIANVTGDDEGAEEEHRSLADALAIVLAHAELRPGRYQYHNPLAKLAPGAVGDVFRDAATGRTPELITFEVTADHLAGLRAMNVAWDPVLDVPGIDPVRPYRGVEPKGDLHREMQPALQIFLRSADIGPGDFIARGGPQAWEPA